MCIEWPWIVLSNIHIIKFENGSNGYGSLWRDLPFLFVLVFIFVMRLLLQLLPNLCSHIFEGHFNFSVTSVIASSVRKTVHASCLMEDHLHVIKLILAQELNILALHVLFLCKEKYICTIPKFTYHFSSFHQCFWYHRYDLNSELVP